MCGEISEDVKRVDISVAILEEQGKPIRLISHVEMYFCSKCARECPHCYGIKKDKNIVDFFEKLKEEWEEDEVGPMWCDCDEQDNV